MANKTVNFKGTVVSASTMDDFYTRLNVLRAADGDSALTLPSLQGVKTLPQQVADAFAAILATKSAVSFLTNVTLTTSFGGVSTGDLLKGPNSMSILEQNIGELEMACRAYFSNNKSGFKGVEAKFASYHGTYRSAHHSGHTAASFSSNHSGHNSVVNSSHRTTHHGSNNAVGNSANRTSNNAPFFHHANTSDSSGFTYRPHHGGGSRTFRGYRGDYGFCPSGTVGCNTVARRNSNESGFFRSNHRTNHSANFTHQHTSNFAGTYASNYRTNHSNNCKTVYATFHGTYHSSKDATVFSSNNSANNVGVAVSHTVVYGTYKVEGLSDISGEQ